MNGAPNATPAFYAMCYPLMQKVALSCGYSLAIHGSLRRDMDVIAAPWEEDAISSEQLAEELAAVLGGDVTLSTNKPHGRVAYVLLINAGLYVDLSVMPRIVKEES